MEHCWTHKRLILIKYINNAAMWQASTQGELLYFGWRSSMRFSIYLVEDISGAVNMQIFLWNFQDGYEVAPGRQRRSFLETSVVTVPGKIANEILNEENYSHSEDNMLLQARKYCTIQANN